MSEGAAAPPIRFGTNGWRGILGRDFHRAGVLALAEALGRAVGRGRQVVVAYDTRAQADALARDAARAIAGAGARALWCGAPVPTPVAGFLVKRRRAAAGFVVTASHNPPEYLGVKILGAVGDSAPRAVVERLARAANARTGAEPRLGRVGAAADPVGPYVARLAALLDTAAIRRARPRILYDAMHGAGAGSLDRALRALGARVVVLRGRPDPSFGGAAPDPIARNLRGLREAVRAGRFAFGVATDGDADRFAVVDSAGRLFSETEALAVLVDHLGACARLRRGVALSVATGRLVERAAGAHGAPVARLPLGFDALTRALERGRADVAGEESGGFAWSALGVGKDGVLAGALLCEAVALGAPLSARLAALERAHGRSACGRSAVPASARALRALARLTAAPPARWERGPVRAVSRRDGVRLALDDGFVHWRRSGTEPVIRLYAEAEDRHALRARLARAARWLR